MVMGRGKRQGWASQLPVVQWLQLGAASAGVGVALIATAGVASAENAGGSSTPDRASSSRSAGATTGSPVSNSAHGSNDGNAGASPRSPRHPARGPRHPRGQGDEPLDSGGGGSHSALKVAVLAQGDVTDTAARPEEVFEYSEEAAGFSDGQQLGESALRRLPAAMTDRAPGPAAARAERSRATPIPDPRPPRERFAQLAAFPVTAVRAGTSLSPDSAAAPSARPPDSLAGAAPAAMPAATVVTPAQARVTATRAISQQWPSRNPVLGLLVGVLSALGLNSPTAPVNPLGALAWGLLRSVETRLRLVPVASTPTIGTPDPITGVVTGSLNISAPTWLPMTYTVSVAPTYGVVDVDFNGAFIYTSTSTSASEDTFAVTASDGLAASIVTVTVPVVPTTDTPTFVVTNTIDVGRYPNGLVFSPDSAKVYVVNSSNDAREPAMSVIDTATKQVVTKTRLSTRLYQIAISPSGETLYATTPGAAVQVFSTTTGVPVLTGTIRVSHGNIGGLAVSPDGAKLYVASNRGPVGTDGGVLDVIDTATGTVTTTISGVGGANNPASRVSVSPDGARVYVAIGTGISVVDAATNTVVPSQSYRSSDGNVAVSPDGKLLYRAGAGPRSVGVFNSATNTLTGEIYIGQTTLNAAAVSPDGKYVYVAYEEFVSAVGAWVGWVSVVDAASNDVIRQIQVGRNPKNLAVSSDGKYIYVSNNWSGSVSVISLT